MKPDKKKIIAAAGTVIILIVAAAVVVMIKSNNSQPKDAEIVDSVYVAHQPDRLEYMEGEEFDPAGTVINANMKDGSIKENVPYEVKCASPLTYSGYSVTFTYEDKSVSIQLNITKRGNAAEYSVEQTPENADSPLKGKTYFFLGSSVTRGEWSEGESMVDFVAKRNACQCIKEAVSGTTLMDNGETSYVQRLDAYLADGNRADHLDAFICQLSTNDIKYPDSFGEVTGADRRSAEDFDRATTSGAIEYIIVKVRETWDCPVVFYTNSDFHNENYETMLALLDQVEEKWGVEVIDLYRDEAFNDISDEDKDLYMSDTTHPTKAGYRDWWTPKFEEKLASLSTKEVDPQ